MGVDIAAPTRLRVYHPGHQEAIATWGWEAAWEKWGVGTLPMLRAANLPQRSARAARPAASQTRTVAGSPDPHNQTRTAGAGRVVGSGGFPVADRRGSRSSSRRRQLGRKDSPFRIG